jgi:hypothetical protein
MRVDIECFKQEIFSKSIAKVLNTLSVIYVPFLKCSPVTYQAFKESSLVLCDVLNHKFFERKVFAFFSNIIGKLKGIEIIITMRLFIATDFLEVYFGVFSSTKEYLLNLLVEVG